MNIYLDIDGVILANSRQPALHAAEFIDYLVNNHSVYWLTTHCRNKGDDPVPMLAPFFTEETIELLKTIKPTKWDMMKTEGINLNQPFLWFDDDLFEEERRVLQEHNALSSHVRVRLNHDSKHLRELLRTIF